VATIVGQMPPSALTPCGQVKMIDTVHEDVQEQGAQNGHCEQCGAPEHRESELVCQRLVHD